MEHGNIVASFEDRTKLEFISRGFQGSITLRTPLLICLVVRAEFCFVLPTPQQVQVEQKIYRKLFNIVNPDLSLNLLPRAVLGFSRSGRYLSYVSL